MSIPKVINWSSMYRVVPFTKTSPRGTPTALATPSQKFFVSCFPSVGSPLTFNDSVANTTISITCGVGDGVGGFVVEAVGCLVGSRVGACVGAMVGGRHAIFRFVSVFVGTPCETTGPDHGLFLSIFRGSAA